ncbi:MAG TPA: efflux RND transporter periplasmic adaptor subunit [Vicinamibacterales bacterium]|nr:efflux RND transporter periplasmic adaptor subunit [Vicinamibacterales bacterium]
MKLFKFAVVAGLVAVAFAGGYLARGNRLGPSAASDGRRVLYYVDPMHPAYTSDKPGIAPDCGMTLEPVYADETAGPLRPERKIVHYRDPQDPDYTSAAAGVNPETGNALEPVYEEPAPLPAGTVRIPPERQQLIGVRFATVEETAAGRNIRTVGKVAWDETRIAHVHPRFDGWIERVFVDFTGELVKKGQPLLTVYSPEMLASQQELLLARRAREIMGRNPLPGAADQGSSLFDASKQRLQLWGLSEAQIEQVLRTGEPIKSIVLPSPASGFVTARNAFPNQRVTAESDLYTIADLSRVWVFADVYEADAAVVSVGRTARVTLPYSDAAPLAARVNYIQPELDPTTRTIKVRLDVPNPGARLKPEMFVNAEFELPGTAQLTVPADAVLDAGDRQTVFVDRGNGYLEPRRVQVGQRLGDRVAILGGLKAGERVVASGTFLVDSESQLRAAAGGMGVPAAHQDHGAAPKGTTGDLASPKPKAKADHD